ncbi:MAG: hypothetical protein IKY66_04440 [Bacteroidales bacterium]|nr:hypothetical protein [Bacteroidales bacterium]
MTPTSFTNPFRYVPHPSVREAARDVMERLDRMIADNELPAEIAKGFSEGKMLGVLVCKEKYLAAFSGNVGGTSIIEGFVPPIYDLMKPDGHYKEHEAKISAVTSRIMEISLSEEEKRRSSLMQEMETEIQDLKLRKKQARTISECQFANGEIKRAKDRWKEKIAAAEEELNRKKYELDSLKKLRAGMSDELQRWIFDQYIVNNAAGEKSSILDIFQQKGLMPPGGTGDCAAPKLLNHAFINGLTPVAMGEFWYGQSPATAVRTHGHFYPSCTSRCYPLLSYMLEGLGIDVGIGWKAGGLTREGYKDMTTTRLYEDKEIIIVSKESGVPSVPGLDGKESLQETLEKKLGISLYPVHRLDMDTSGIIIYAKTKESESALKKQFEENTVRKTYMARLSPADNNGHSPEAPGLNAGDKGSVDLPLSPDYDERPRQKADRSQGKTAQTEYEVTSVNEDGTTDILFYPHTGRTHQLRVHSSHTLGLGRPIVGDLLYGGCGNVWTEGSSCARLHLHAFSITFRHPKTGESLTFTTSQNCY